MLKGGMRWILKNEWIWVAILLTMYIRIPTLLEPYWYGDETMYLTIGQNLREGAVLYKDIFDHKPPLIYWVAAGVNGNQFWYRMVAAGVNVAAVGMFALLAKRLLPESKKAAMVATAIFVLITNLPVWEGNIGNAENFFILFTITSAYLLLAGGGKLSKRRIVGAGLILGIGGLFKIPPLLEVVVWPWVWWSYREKGWLTNSLLMGLATMAPLVLSVGWFTIMGDGKAYLIAAGLQNVGYVSVWEGAGGIYLLRNRMMLLAVGLGGLWAIAQRIPRREMWVATWAITGLCAVTLSGRPYPHYLLQMAPVLALAVGLIMVEKWKGKVVALGVIGLTGLTVIGFKFWAYPVVGYYQNFWMWITGQRNREEYMGWFGKQVNVNYRMAARIDELTQPGEYIFTWADDPSLYALANRRPVGRYTVRFHVLYFKAEAETLAAIKQRQPKVIVVGAPMADLPGLEGLIEERYKPIKVEEGKTLYLRQEENE